MEQHPPISFTFFRLYSELPCFQARRFYLRYKLPNFFSNGYIKRYMNFFPIIIGIFFLIPLCFTLINMVTFQRFLPFGILQLFLSMQTIQLFFSLKAHDFLFPDNYLALFPLQGHLKLIQILLIALQLSQFAQFYGKLMLLTIQLLILLDHVILQKLIILTTGLLNNQQIFIKAIQFLFRRQTITFRTELDDYLFEYFNLLRDELCKMIDGQRVDYLSIDILLLIFLLLIIQVLLKLNQFLLFILQDLFNIIQIELFVLYFNGVHGSVLSFQTLGGKMLKEDIICICFQGMKFYLFEGIVELIGIFLLSGDYLFQGVHFLNIINVNIKYQQKMDRQIKDIF